MLTDTQLSIGVLQRARISNDTPLFEKIHLKKPMCSLLSQFGIRVVSETETWGVIYHG